jgi:hypothetical protein
MPLGAGKSTAVAKARLMTSNMGQAFAGKWRHCGAAFEVANSA